MKRRADTIVFIALIVIGLCLACDDIVAWITGQPPVLIGGAHLDVHGGKYANLYR